jgi:hypothetical protein
MDEDIMRLVEAVSADPEHEQRGINLVATSWGSLKRLRDEVNAIIRDGVASLPPDHAWRHVKAWRWRTASLGTPITDAGRQYHLELRLSWYNAPQFWS